MTWLTQHLNPGPAVSKVLAISLKPHCLWYQEILFLCNTTFSDSARQMRPCYTSTLTQLRPPLPVIHQKQGPIPGSQAPFLTYNWELPFMFLHTTVKLLCIYFIVIIIFITLTIILYIPSVSDETCRRWKILGWVGMLQIVSVLFISVLILHGPYFYMQFKEQVA